MLARRYRFALAIMIVMLVAGWLLHLWLTPPSATISVRISMQLVIDGQPVNASQTYEMRFVQYGPQRYHQTARGQALIFETANRRTVFGLMAWRAEFGFDFTDIFTECREKRADDDHRSLTEWVNDYNGACNLPIERLPALVDFPNLNDPRSIRVLKPKSGPPQAQDEVQFIGATITRSTEDFDAAMRSPTPMDVLPFLTEAAVNQNSAIFFQSPPNNDFDPSVFYKRKFR